MEREETEEKESVRKTEKERYEMKYKVGDRVRVRRDLQIGTPYGDWLFSSGMNDYKGKVVTISGTYPNKYRVREDKERWVWTDEMLEGLVEDELTAEEAIRLRAKMCVNNSCNECRSGKRNNGEGINCCEFSQKYPERVIEILKQFKKDHEKKEVETELVDVIRIIEDTGDIKRCVHEERTDVEVIEIYAEAERVLKDWCKDHGGKFFAMVESRCVVKE